MPSGVGLRPARLSRGAIQMPLKKRDRLGPRVAGGSRIVSCSGVVVKGVIRILVDMQLVALARGIEGGQQRGHASVGPAVELGVDSQQRGAHIGYLLDGRGRCS